jgi:hypothetical protein
MNRKDIALSVAGVLATMALAYLFYRQQAAATAAAAAATPQDVTDPYSMYADPNYAYQYAGSAASAIPTVSVPTYSADSGQDTSASTAAGVQAPTDDNSLLSQIIAAYHGDSTDTSQSSVDFASLAIPTATVTPTITIGNIPQTAADATSNAQNMLGVSGVNGGAVSPPSTVPVSTTTNPVKYNHILTSQTSAGVAN